MLAAVACVAALSTSWSLPAAADQDACAVHGVAVTNRPLHVPGLFPAEQADFVFSNFVGTCLRRPTVPTAAGWVAGWCGWSIGGGQTNAGHDFSWLGAGGVLVFTGELLGTAHVTADATAGHSCLQGATRFLVTGTVTFEHAP